MLISKARQIAAIRFKPLGPCLWFAMALSLCAPSAFAVDIPGTRWGAFGLPEINVIFRPSAGAAPYEGVDLLLEWPLINLRMVFDTGASGIILGTEPAQQIGIPIAQFNNTEVVFGDVGVGGEATFGVSDTVHMSLGQFDLPLPNEYDPATEAQAYPRDYPDVRLQVGPLCPPLPPPCLFSGVVGQLSQAGIAGMPTMLDKISVIQPKLGENPLDTIHTYVYEPGVAPVAGPGLLTPDLRVELTLQSFDRFTEVTPAGAAGPTLSANPFIGPDPLTGFDGNTFVTGAPPGITVSFNGKQVVGSFLLDTGGQISSISREMAAALHVRYVPNCVGVTCPRLETFDPLNPANPGTLLANQFKFTPTGIGGQETLAGFYLDSMQIKTREGNPNDSADPYHINFSAAPVFVQSIELTDSVSGKGFVFDGILGMNFLMASIDSSSPGTFQPGAFDALILDFDSSSPEPPQLGLIVTAGIELPASPATGTQVPIPLFVGLVMAASFITIGSRKQARA